MCVKCTVMLTSPSAIWIMDWEVEYRAEPWVMLHHHCEICLCMTERDSVGGDLCFCAGRKGGGFTCVSSAADTCTRPHSQGDVCVPNDCVCWSNGRTRRQLPVRKNIEINSSTTCRAPTVGFLCKSNRVEHWAPASYFCSKNALSEVMRTVFEVAPAGKYSRRLREPSPPTQPTKKKSLFSSNCCFPPEKASCWQFYTEFDKSGGENGGSAVWMGWRGWEER